MMTVGMVMYVKTQKQTHMGFYYLKHAIAAKVLSTDCYNPILVATSTRRTSYEFISGLSKTK
ncbi:hypothetical protein ACFSQP_03540 [Bizionia sediminis]|uniref:Uncharacterized protein n=1 Tax=Bizionia sediminis TaxID=1737064 RepID=A0ABW5KPX2_9FLAO